MGKVWGVKREIFAMLYPSIKLNKFKRQLNRPPNVRLPLKILWPMTMKAAHDRGAPSLNSFMMKTAGHMPRS
jgi:hypothetical protein